MKKSYLLFIACLVSLIWSCSEEARDYNIENKEAIEYLEKEYNVEILSTSCVITDSILSQVESKLREEDRLLTDFNLRANVIRDSIKSIYSVDSTLMTAANNYPIRYPRLETYDRSLTHVIYVTSYWVRLEPEVYVTATAEVITTQRWRFDYIHVHSEAIFKELTFEISAYNYIIYEGIGIGTRYRIDGEASHYQGWIWMNAKKI